MYGRDYKDAWGLSRRDYTVEVSLGNLQETFKDNNTTILVTPFPKIKKDPMAIT